MATGKHQVTALTREGSTSSLPRGVQVAYIDYDDEESIAQALSGQQVLIITLSVAAPKETESKLFRAAAKAGVPYVIPNWYAQDPKNTALLDDTFLRSKCNAARKEIAELGKSSWIQLTCGFWYEFSLAFGPDTFGFDFQNRSLTWFDDGDTKICSTTWDQCGRAMAALLSLPEYPQDEHASSPTLSQFCNDVVYIKSFEISQKDIFESVKRVTKTSDADWTFHNETARERHAEGLAEVKAGNMGGFSKVLYSRVFYPEDAGNFSQKCHNALLGLPEESIDERTKAAIQMVEDKLGSKYVNDASNEGRRKMIDEEKKE